MRTVDYELLYQLEEKYWWFAAMREITDAVAGPELQKKYLRILDAGCGTGYNLGHYGSKDSFEIYGIDISSDALEWVRKRGFRKIAQGSVTEIPYQSEVFNIVFSFDVLQQLRPDTNEDALREMHRVLKPGGLLFIRVAAFEWLRSSHDDDIQSMHRFSRNELAQKLRDAHFEIEYISYANSFLFPFVVVRRLLKHAGIGGGTDVKPLPRGFGWIDSIFRGILASEAKWLSSGKTFPFGVSVICRARKGTAGGTAANSANCAN